MRSVSETCPWLTESSLARFEVRPSRAFFARDAREVARDLIGMSLVHLPGLPDVAVGDASETALAGAGSQQAIRAVRIVETEAYCGPADAACHARFGLTPRTRALFGPPGHAYVFLIYGMYDCMNVVCLAEGSGHAVLVRGGEPLIGIPKGVRADGPGRLTRALGITRSHNGVDLMGRQLMIAEGVQPACVATSPRVGVAYAGAIAEAPWRFIDPESPHVSRPSPRMIGLGQGVGARPAAKPVSNGSEGLPRPAAPTPPAVTLRGGKARSAKLAQLPTPSRRGRSP